MPFKKLTGLKVTDEAKGQVRAVFATLNVKDLDGDVTVPGAFEDGAAVRISAYNHKSWEGALPVGKGTIHEEGDEAILDGEFFLGTEAGKDTFEVVKQMGDLQEWSYGFDVIDGAPGTHNGESVNFLRKLKTHEVSPVILGAGLRTRTLAVKSREEKQLMSELYTELREAGMTRYGGERAYVYVDNVDIDAGWVVYCVSTPDGERLLRANFLRGADGDVALADGEEEVETVTSYAPKQAPAASTKGAEDEEPADPPEDEEDDEDDEEDEPEQGKRLGDELDEAIAAVESASTRVADAVAQRAENGQKLAEATLERAERLKSTIERLHEALATEPPSNDNSDDDGWSLDIEHDLARLS